MSALSLPDCQAKLAGASLRRRQDYHEPHNESWFGSPYAWLRDIKPVPKSREMRRILLDWLRAIGVDALDASHRSSALLLPGGIRAAVKASLLWLGNDYHFQQIRDGDYDAALLFGVSPFDAHLWLVPREELLARSQPQHADESRLLIVCPGAVPEWLLAYGGDLAHAAEVLGAFTAFTGQP